MPITGPDSERDEPQEAQPTDTGADDRTDAEREATEFGGE